MVQHDYQRAEQVFIAAYSAALKANDYKRMLTSSSNLQNLYNVQGNQDKADTIAKRLDLLKNPMSTPSTSPKTWRTGGSYPSGQTPGTVSDPYSDPNWISTPAPSPPTFSTSAGGFSSTFGTASYPHSGDVFVHDYERRNGTDVGSHFRTRPDGDPTIIQPLVM